MHAHPPLANSPIISSYSSKKCLPKISVAHFTKWFTISFLLLLGGGCILSISLCQPLHAVWVPFWLSKHRLSNTLSQHQSNSQAELSKPTRDDSRYPKENEPEVFLNTFPHTNLAYNAISAYLIIWWLGPQLRRGLHPLEKLSPLKKCLRLLYA